MFETTRPIQNRRKSRCSSADHAEVRPGSAAVASSSASVSSSGARSFAVKSRQARVHGSRTHHGTFYAPSTVLKTEGLTGAPALSIRASRETHGQVSGQMSTDVQIRQGGRRSDARRLPKPKIDPLCFLCL